MRAEEVNVPSSTALVCSLIASQKLQIKLASQNEERMKALWTSQVENQMLGVTQKCSLEDNA